MKYLKTYKLFELFEKKNPEIFFRKTKNPENDIKRNFSCYIDAWFNNYEDAYKYLKTSGGLFQEPKKDPITGKWCGGVESGLSGYIVRNEDEFNEAIEELTKFFPHLKDINEISVFESKDYFLEDGSDLEDTFTNAKYLFNIDINSTYSEYVKKLKDFKK